MRRKPTAEVSAVGVAAVALAMARDLGWVFREQPVEDCGIDAQVEIAEGEIYTGRLLALQIKSGLSYFREPDSEGWWYRPDADHSQYWMNYSLPVVIVFHHPETGLCHWELVSQDALLKTSAGGRKMFIPKAHVLDKSARGPLANAAVPWQSPTVGMLRRAHGPGPRDGANDAIQQGAGTSAGIAAGPDGRDLEIEAALAYLALLVQWLDVDPWPQDARLAGPELVPSAVERKLWVAGADEEGLDADELSDQCHRLVILGDPGTGKTWLARRAARRCALAALARLAEGASLDQVELPLFTTCARLTAMSSGDDIRDAITRSALAQLPDLGARVASLVRRLFARRSAPTLVVLDSLDEAPGPDDRIRQADELPPPWRVILTSRPSFWKGQLTVRDDDPSRRSGTLQPLRYPQDVEPFISRWFTDAPERGVGLAAQIRDRWDLREAVTVPLILAFYCIISEQGPLPASTADLHDKVIARMLTGLWRGSDHQADLGACLRTLRHWAWLAAVSDPVSGVGTWVDVVLTPQVGNLAIRAALEHVAIPQGPPDPGTGMVPRRFVHRSLQEHLVAGYVASLDAEDAAGALIGHLWYDPDWQPYAAPTAIALHPERDEVLRSIVRRVTGRDKFPGEILALDACSEIRLLLTLAAHKTTEADWSPEAAALICSAMRDLPAGKDAGYFTPPDGWPTFSDLLLRELVTLLESGPRLPWDDREFALLAGARPTGPDCERLRAAVFSALPQAGARDVLRLASLVLGLTPSAAERAIARTHVACALGKSSSRYYRGRGAQLLADLAATSEERAQAAVELISQLGECKDHAAEIARVIDRLDPAAGQREEARAILLGRLAAGERLITAASLCEALAVLRPTSGEQADALGSMTRLIIDADHIYGQPIIAKAVAAITTLDLDRVRGVLIAEIARQASREDVAKACDLTHLVTELDPTGDERARVKHELLIALGAQSGREPTLSLALAGMDLMGPDADPAESELFRALALGANLALCAQQKPGQRSGQRPFETLLRLADTADERARCGEVILDHLARGEPVDIRLDAGEALIALAGIPEHRERAWTTLVARLDDAEQSHAISSLAEMLYSLARKEGACERLRIALHGKLGGTGSALPLIRAARTADPTSAATEAEKDEARKVLLKTFPGDSLYTSESSIWNIVAVIGGLSTDEHERAEARRILLSALHEHGDGTSARYLAMKIEDLRPVALDLDSLGDQPVGLIDRALAAIRRNSATDDWLAVLPKLTKPRKHKGASGGRPRPGGPEVPSAPRHSG